MKSIYDTTQLDFLRSAIYIELDKNNFQFLQSVSLFIFVYQKQIIDFIIALILQYLQFIREQEKSINRLFQISCVEAFNQVSFFSDLNAK